VEESPVTETSSPRERYRRQVRAEVKDLAWQQIAEAGASGISLNAIAKKMGMSGPALYRYFANRDELMTALIGDAHRDIADVVSTAVAGEPDAAARPAVIAHALRRWALAQPHRYFLVHGTPVPGYVAPPETLRSARRVMAALLDTFAELRARDERPLDEHLATHREWAEDHPAPPSALRRALTFWTRTHGVISLELAGQFTGMGFDPEQLFAEEVDVVLAESEQDVPPREHRSAISSCEPAARVPPAT
jgi:AcrR family transcriptional regulator